MANYHCPPPAPPNTGHNPCTCHTKLPAAESKARSVLEPLVDIDLQQRACREVKALCADTLPLVADRLCEHARSLPPAYWETLLTPWAMNVSKQVVERWWRVKAMVQAWGQEPLHVPLLPKDCSFSFATGPDFVMHGALGHSYNHWLFSRLLEEVFPPAWSMEYLPAVQKSYEEEEQLSGKEKLREVLRNLMLRLPCPRLKGMSTGQSLRFSLALLHRSHGPDKSRPQVEYGSAATGIAADFPESFARTLVTLFMASLPQLLASHKHPARLTRDRSPLNTDAGPYPIPFVPRLPKWKNASRAASRPVRGWLLPGMGRRLTFCTTA